MVVMIVRSPIVIIELPIMRIVRLLKNGGGTFSFLRTGTLPMNLFQNGVVSQISFHKPLSLVFSIVKPMAIKNVPTIMSRKKGRVEGLSQSVNSPLMNPITAVPEKAIASAI